MARNMQKIEIDGQKLKNAILKRGLHTSVVSKELGCSKCYLDQHIKNNYTLKTTAIALEQLYRIPLSEYEVVKVDESVKAAEEAKAIEKEDLKNLIFQATYKAVYMALEDAVKASGIIEALEELREAWK